MIKDASEVNKRVIRSVQLGLPSVWEGETENRLNTREFAHCGLPGLLLESVCLEGVDGVVAFSAGFAGVRGCSRNILAGLILCCCELEEIAELYSVSGEVIEKYAYSEGGGSVERGERVGQDCRGSLVHCAGRVKPISAIPETYTT